MEDESKNYMTDEQSEEMTKRFTYHPPKQGQIPRYGLLRKRAEELARVISVHCPNSAERSTAIRRVEEAVMWANAAIARNE